MKACTQCGRCCTDDKFMGSMEASGADVKRWRREKRSDILFWAEIIGPRADPYADLWINQVTGKEAERCPFVRKIRGVDRYTCTIYDTRPQPCRDYPWHVGHMRSVNCEMLEAGDTDSDVARFMGRTEPEPEL